jgi:mxaL protein
MRRSIWPLGAALALLLATFIIPPVVVRRPVFTVIAVLDITGSMNARDQSLNGALVSRIEMEKAALQSLLTALPCGSRLGVGIFVEERPFLLFAPAEVCANDAPLRTSIAGIDWRMGWDSESHIAAGLRASVVTAQAHDAELIFMTDGQEMPPLSWSAPVDFAPVRGRAAGLIIGVGGGSFVPIPKFDRAGRDIGVWKPGEVPSETGGLFKGHEYLTAVNEPHLRELAAEAGLAYHHLTEAGDLLPALASSVPVRSAPTSVDLRSLPATLALALLAFANVMPARRVLVASRLIRATHAAERFVPPKK